MRNFFNFNKNTGALVVLVFSFFISLTEIKAQWSQVTALGDTITVTVPGQGGACSERAVLYNSPAYFNMGWGVAQQNTQNFEPNKRFLATAGVPMEITITFRPKANSNRYIDASTQNGYAISSNAQPGAQVAGQWPLWSWGGVGAPQTFKMLAKFDTWSDLGNVVTWGIKVESVTNSYTFSLNIPFIVKGILDTSVPILGTTVQPQIPYMVLHAPPGDGSSSEFQETKTTCREFTDTYAEDGSNSANLAVKLGVQGSIGFIATIDYEFSVTFSAGITAGDLAVTTKSNQTCITASQGFSTNELLGNNGSGDVFIGYGTDLNYGLYRHQTIDQNTCKAKIDTGLIYCPTGTPRKFVYTEEAIQSEIINQKALAVNPALSVRQRNEAQNQADVWEKVLAMNNANKNNPNNALIENISFSAGANSSQESSITVLETQSLEVEHYIDFNTGVSAVMEIGGSGVSGGYEYKGSYNYGKTNNVSAEVAKVVRYSLADDDGGDAFNLKVVRDPMYGTPVFRVEPTSKSSCPYQGGYQRDQPKLKHDGTTNDHITSADNPVGSSATFKVDICNESNEARTYNLKLNAQSNLNGAVVSAAGVPLNGNDLGQSFNVPANGCVQDLIIEVKQLSANSPLSYPDLELFLYSPCEEDIQTSVFASVFFGTSGVNDLTDNSLLSVSPNPTSGWLQISLPEGNSLEAVRVMDLSGKTVRNLELGAAASNTAIDLSGLPKGIYALQARSEGKVFLKKVVVE
jgi:Secretion system C-terminal sorting domain